MARGGRWNQLLGILSQASTSHFNQLDRRNFIRAWLEYLTGDENVIREAHLTVLFDECKRHKNCGELVRGLAQLHAHARQRGELDRFFSDPYEYHDYFRRFSNKNNQAWIELPVFTER